MEFRPSTGHIGRRPRSPWRRLLAFPGAQRMRLLVLSDLHLEHRPRWRLPEKFPPFDVAVLAGDIEGSPRKSIELLAATPALGCKPCVLVAGNHEFYGGEIERCIE